MFLKNLKHHRVPIILLLVFCGIYFYSVFSEMLLLNEQGLIAGHPYVWSDWALHLAMSNTFAFKDPEFWFQSHPVYGAAKLNYPFFTNFVSGMLVRLGMEIPSSFIYPSILYALLICFGIYCLSFHFLRSRLWSILTLILFFCSAGLGFVFFFQKLWETGDWGLWLHPPQEYSRFEKYQWGSGNVLVGLLVPQRAFLLGMTFAIWSMYFFFSALQNENLRYRRLIMLAGGLLAGLLPITHMHSLIAMSLMAGLPGLANFKRWKIQLYYVIPLLLLGGTLYFAFLAGNINSKEFFKWMPGWTATSVSGWIEQWSMQWGFMIPTAVAGLILILRSKNFTFKVFSISFFALFLFSNLILFQPSPWDNSKIFLWVYLGFSLMVTMVLRWLWANKKFTQALAIVLFLLLTLTGITELIRLPQTSRNQFMIASRSDLDLAEIIREKTEPQAMFLTAAIHNHPVAIWAPRPVVLGYEGWAMNFGFPTAETRQKMDIIYDGGDLALDLIRQLKISYIDFDRGISGQNIDFYRERFTAPFQNDRRIIFDVSSAWKK